MTPQQIYDTVLAHLRKQGKAAVHMKKEPRYDGEIPICRYRTPDGLSCAVGCLLPDSSYNPDIEGAGVIAAVEHAAGLLAAVEHHYAGVSETVSHKALFKILKELGLVPHYKLLGDLQHVHDQILREYGLDEFEDSMIWVAMKHGLVYQQPQTS